MPSQQTKSQRAKLRCAERITSSAAQFQTCKPLCIPGGGMS